MTDLEQRNKDWNAGFRQGRNHAEPSEKTLKYMTDTNDKLEKLRLNDEQHNIALSVMKRDIKNIIEQNATEHSQIMNRLEKIDNMIDEHAKCYASKNELNKIENTVEKLKQFRWQVLAIMAVIMWLIDRFGDKFLN